MKRKSIVNADSLCGLSGVSSC